MEKDSQYCTTRLDIGKNACLDSITIKESKLFEQLKLIIDKMLSSKENIRQQIAEKVAEYINPKELIKQKKELEDQLYEVDKEISKMLEHGALLVSRGFRMKKS